MKRMSKEELEKLREREGYNPNADLCPWCGILLVKVPYEWDEKEESFVCRACYVKLENIGGKF